MNREHDFIRALEGYLEEFDGATPLPDETRDAIRAELPSTRQIPAWWPGWRLPEMNTIAKFSVAAAVVAVAALLGFNYLIAPDVGDPDADDASPSPSATTAAVAPDLNEQDGSLAAGSYSVAVPQHTITFTVPNGWTKNIVDSVVWSDSSESRISFGELDRVRVDPCRRELGLVQTGTTVEELEAALAGMAGVETAASDVTISGFDGRRVEMTVSPPTDPCTGDDSQLDEQRPLEPGIHRFVILDVEGVRVVITAIARTAASDSETQQLDAIIDSIEIR